MAELFGMCDERFGNIFEECQIDGKSVLPKTQCADCYDHLEADSFPDPICSISPVIFWNGFAWGRSGSLGYPDYAGADGGTDVIGIWLRRTANIFYDKIP